jgi:hypothetical protein
VTFYWHLQFAGAFAKTLARGRAFSTRSLEPQWISSPSPVRVRCDVSACGTHERAPRQHNPYDREASVRPRQRLITTAASAAVATIVGSAVVLN